MHTTTTGSARSGGLSVDPFIDNERSAAMRMNSAASEPGPVFRRSFAAIDVYCGKNGEDPLCLTKELSLEDVVLEKEHPGYDESGPRCLHPTFTGPVIRAIFFKSFEHRRDDLRQLTRYASIPSAYWDASGNGSFGMRTTQLPGGERAGRDSWLQILRKLPRASRGRWSCPSVFLKHREPDDGQSPTKLIVLCMDTGEALYNSLLDVAKARDAIDLMLKDPFHIYLLIMVEWYGWINTMYWALRDDVGEIETTTTEGDLNPATIEALDFGRLHRLAKDVIQALEVVEVAIRSITTMQKAHEGIAFDDSERAAAQHAQEAQEYHRMTFQGAATRITTLEKRLNNQINLAFNLVQQRDARTALRDSNSMTSIAILTLVFLPSTAIATIFSMPFFMPEAKESALQISPSLRYFWAFSVPITFAALLTWYVIRKMVNRRTEQGGRVGRTIFKMPGLGLGRSGSGRVKQKDSTEGVATGERRRSKPVKAGKETGRSRLKADEELLASAVNPPLPPAKAAGSRSPWKRSKAGAEAAAEHGQPEMLTPAWAYGQPMVGADTSTSRPTNDEEDWGTYIGPQRGAWDTMENPAFEYGRSPRDQRVVIMP
ncbi:MAG: hypothetical protein M1832_002356 [Thelocarpon impressellum]|nr:MAG: hypothetical protein M1832_002356 [Thelocarpon impressellum]